MADFNFLVDGFAVAPQLLEADVRAAAEQGFKTIINNRPEGEAADQPAGDVIEAAATAAGIAYIAAPMVPGTLPEDAIAAARDAEGPVLAFCRSGMRSTAAWAVAQARTGAHTPDAIVQTAARAGYDLSGMAPVLAAESPR
ncbi:MAG: TIGR01244 family sulfur transferase [Maricaulaceae bacterium]